MRRAPLAALFLVLVLSGCAAPAVEPTRTPNEGPLDLSSQRGLFLLDLDANTVTILSREPSLAWLSPNATRATWTEPNFATVYDRASGARDVGPVVVWARTYDNGTGIELVEGRALLRGLTNGTELWNASLPDAPPPVGKWGAASDDLQILGAEVTGARPLTCTNELILRTATLERFTGCHLRVAADGRAGWTEATGVRVRARDGTITNTTGPGTGDRAAGTFVAHENPVFTADGVAMLRLTGGDTLALTEVLDAEGSVVAKMTGPRRLALLDASADGRMLMVSGFDR